MSSRSNQQHGEIAFRNDGDSSIELVLEPWADQRTIATGGRAVVTFSGPEGGQIEIEHSPRRLVVYAWEGAVVRVEDD